MKLAKCYLIETQTVAGSEEVDPKFNLIFHKAPDVYALGFRASQFPRAAHELARWGREPDLNLTPQDARDLMQLVQDKLLCP